MMLPSNLESRWTELTGTSQYSDGWQLAQLSSIQEMLPLVKTLIGAMKLRGFHEKDIFSVRLAVEEAVVNSIKHGNRNDPSKQVAVRFKVGHEQVLVEVEDQGHGFDPSQVPDPTAPENLERCGGRGILFMRTFMTWIRFSERGNCVTLCKSLSAALSAGS
jgi:serine/threonine-protein kinase RsbW